MVFTIWVVTTVFVVAKCSFLDGLPKCKRNDPKFDKCLITAVGQTLPLLEHCVSELEIPSMQPIVVNKALVPSVKTLPFKEKYKNIRCYNHASSNVILLQSKVTDSNFWLRLNGYNPKIVFLADYVYEDAIVLGLNMSSAGNVSFTHYGYGFELVMSGNVTQQLGARYLTVTNATVSMTAENFDVVYQNDDLQLSQVMSGVITKNWALMWNDVKDQISGVYAEAYKNIANLIFGKVDYDVLFPS